MSKLGFQASPSQCILEVASTLASCMKLWPKNVFGTASAEAAHEALHTAMSNEPLAATVLIMITIKWVMQINKVVNKTIP